MFRVRRIAAALVLATAVFMMPLALDLCAATCELRRPTAHAAEPTCHHQPAGIVHVGSLPLPCGHDHHVVANDTALPPQPDRALTSTVALAPDALWVNAALMHSAAERGFDRSPLESPSLHFSVSLRI